MTNRSVIDGKKDIPQPSSSGIKLKLSRQRIEEMHQWSKDSEGSGEMVGKSKPRF